MHQHLMSLGSSSMLVAPSWVVYILAAAFFSGFGFYLYRLLFSEKVSAIYGYWDPENEVGHGICMLAMAFHLAPDVIPSSFSLWAALLYAGVAWFTARAVSWGRKVSYPTKWWWDWAHVGMLLGMALMFYPLNLGIWFQYLQAAFWLWFAGYYAYSFVQDSRHPNAYYLGSDASHFLMGAVMLVMTVWPGLLMSNHHAMMPDFIAPICITR